jgi:CheY-like chemotaxis protein
MEHSTLVGCSILLVGHEPRTARQMRKTLEGAGAHICEAPNEDDALRLIDTDDPSAAVLDYTRSIHASHRLPARLTRLGIPFVFCKDIGRNEAWPQARVLSKPISGTDLIETLHQLLGLEFSEASELMGGADGFKLAEAETSPKETSAPQIRTPSA